MDINTLITQAFDRLNLPETDFSVTLTEKPHSDPSMKTMVLQIQRLMMPGQRLKIEFEYEKETNFVTDVFAETNTLFRGKQFRTFFEPFTKPEIILFS